MENSGLSPSLENLYKSSTFILIFLLGFIQSHIIFDSPSLTINESENLFWISLVLSLICLRLLLIFKIWFFKFWISDFCSSIYLLKALFKFSISVFNILFSASKALYLSNKIFILESLSINSSLSSILISGYFFILVNNVIIILLSLILQVISSLLVYISNCSYISSIFSWKINILFCLSWSYE